MNAEQRIKLQLGELIMQLAMLSADNEAKDEKIKELEAKLPPQDDNGAAAKTSNIRGGLSSQTSKA